MFTRIPHNLYKGYTPPVEKISGRRIEKKQEQRVETRGGSIPLAFEAKKRDTPVYFILPNRTVVRHD